MSEKFFCQICGEEYLTREGALKCESLGRPEPALEVGERFIFFPVLRKSGDGMNVEKLPPEKRRPVELEVKEISLARPSGLILGERVHSIRCSCQIIKDPAFWIVLSEKELSEMKKVS